MPTELARVRGRLGHVGHQLHHVRAVRLGVHHAKQQAEGAVHAVLAGAGLKKGLVYGATDEFGFAAVENKVHIHDLHATILALLGFDHTKLTYRYNGRDFRLTDVAGQVVKPLIA